ncbi:hypothetical protein WJX84_008719 [Apatococcus fuscideae]|uniref:SAP domain-containing protein n=1 Tax=Apatococcus fuscideae TaxID=2026836 RepID=A0AAW1TLJ5_9CHLO
MLDVHSSEARRMLGPCEEGPSGVTSQLCPLHSALRLHRASARALRRTFSSAVAARVTLDRAPGVPEPRLSEEERKRVLTGWRQQPAAAPVHTAHSDESAMERASYHRTLLQAAQSGNATSVEGTLHAMTAAGMPPGPKAYHALIFAHARAGNAAGALAAIRREYMAGIQPLPETYTTLMVALLAEGEMEQAEQVLQSVSRAQLPVFSCWTMLVSGLFKRGQMEHGQALLQQGVEGGLQPDGPVLEELIKCLCRKEMHGAAYKAVTETMKEYNVQPELKHVVPVVQLYAAAGQYDQARRLISDMSREHDAVSNIAVYNAFLKGAVDHRSAQAAQGRTAEGFSDQLMDLRGELAQVSLSPSLETFALLTELYVLAGDIKASTEAFLGTSGTGRSVRRSRATSFAQQSAVGKLITFLARQGQPDPLLAVLRAVDTDAQPLPVETMQDTDAEGRSFLTRWLPSWIQAQQPSAPSMPEGGLMQRHEELEQQRVIDGVLIGAGNCAITDDGAVISPSKMTVDQIRAELIARDLPIEGKRKEIYKRLQAARRAMPTDIIATQKQRAAKLQVKKTKAIATATQQQVEDDKEGGSKKKLVKLHVEQMVHGRLVKTWTQDKLMEEAALNPAPVRTEVVGADNASKPLSILAGERGDGEAIEADGDEEDAREFSLRQAKSNDPASPLMRLVSTFVNTAVSLKLQPTEADFRELLQVLDLDPSGVGIAKVVADMLLDADSYLSRDTVQQLQRTCIEVCLQGDRPLMAEQILKEAADRNYTMDFATQQQIEQAASRFRSTLA